MFSSCQIYRRKQKEHVMNCGLRTIQVWIQNLAEIVCYFTIGGNLKGTYNSYGPLISSLLYTENSMVVTREGRELEGVV